MHRTNRCTRSSLVAALVVGKDEKWWRKGKSEKSQRKSIIREDIDITLRVRQLETLTDSSGNEHIKSLRLSDPLESMEITRVPKIHCS